MNENYDYRGDLLDFFADHKGSIVHKWHHYIPIYDRYLSKYRNKRVGLLEIGVSKGGSLEMWREYFGEDARIYGIDIDPDCKQFDGVAGHVRIGSQDDPNFLNSVVSEIKKTGGLDIVIDDGSHLMTHIRKSFEILYPAMNKNSIYILEDLHTAYWRAYE